MSEMLHQAKQSGENHILLKLDVWKAFDRLEWPFLLAIVEKAGMGGVLSSFLEASFQSASSLVILNGRATNHFKLLRSVRQGCPLSPLLFNLAFDVISHMLQRAVASRYIIGVEFPVLGLSTLHNMFADNLALIIRAAMIYVIRCRKLLTTFGNASGLKFLWEQTVASFIPEGPPPLEFWLLPWKWEETANASPHLGFPVAGEFLVDLIEAQVLARIKARLVKLQGKFLSLAARITVANGLILSSLWYLITLWPGDLEFFNLIQKRLAAFVWAGRPRVDRNTICQSKARGGLGMLSIIEQYRAMAGKLMVWILGPGTHPLRTILRAHIQELSKRKWGVEDMSWVVTMGGSPLSFGSPSWQNLCKAWSALKPQLRCAPPRNREEWNALPLWRPHVHHLSTAKVKYVTQAQTRLREAGLTSLGDITDPDGQFKQWNTLPVDLMDAAGRRAYNALTANIRPLMHFEHQPGSMTSTNHWYRQLGPLSVILLCPSLPSTVGRVFSAKSRGMCPRYMQY